MCGPAIAIQNDQGIKFISSRCVNYLIGIAYIAATTSFGLITYAEFREKE